jgi:hypothetical protein
MKAKATVQEQAPSTPLRTGPFDMLRAGPSTARNHTLLESASKGITIKMLDGRVRVDEGWMCMKCGHRNRVQRGGVMQTTDRS